MKFILINRKNLSHFLLIIILVSMLGSFGCSSFMKLPWQTKVTTTYEGMGITLNTAKPVLMTLCSTGAVNPTDCAEIKAVYNKAVKMYKDLGDLASAALDTGNSTKYKSKKEELLALLEAINNFLLAHQ